jgi:CRP-like cAMP-binding protein
VCTWAGSIADARRSVSLHVSKPEMNSSGLLTVLKAKRKLMKSISNRQRRKLLALDDEDSGKLLVWRDYNVQEVRRIAQKPANSRTTQELEVLCDVLGNVSVFHKLDRARLHDLAIDARLRVLQPGDILCKEAEQGNVMWAIVQGNLEGWQGGEPAPLKKYKPKAAVDNRGSISERAHAPNKAVKLSRKPTRTSSLDLEHAVRSIDYGAMVSVATPTQPGYCGEMALLNAKSTRKCTLRAGLPDNPSGMLQSELDTVLLEITRQQFETTALKIVQQQTKEKMTCLRMCATFNGLTNSQLSKLLYYMEEVNFPPHCTVARKGEPVTNLYLIVSGECNCLDEMRQHSQQTSVRHTHGSGTTAARAYNRILSASTARKREITSQGTAWNNGIEASAWQKQQSGRGSSSTQGKHSIPFKVADVAVSPRRIEISKIAAGRLIGDVEVTSPPNTPQVFRHLAAASGRVWRHSYVSVGRMTCYAITPSDFQKRVLDGHDALSRQMANEGALKLSWREKTLQLLHDKHRYTVGAKNGPTVDEHSDGVGDSGETVLVPVPPKELREGVGKAKPARALADRYGSAVETTSTLCSYTDAAESVSESKTTTPAAGQERGHTIVPASLSDYPDGAPDSVPPEELQPEVIPAYPALAYASLQSPRKTTCSNSALPASQAELSEWSWAVLQEEHRTCQVASQHRLGTRPYAGSVTLELGGRVAWGGSRVPRRCPFFTEPPEALWYAEQKDIEQEQHIKAQTRLIGTNISKIAIVPVNHDTSSSTRSSSCCRLHESSSAVSSFPRSYSARTGRAAATPRFPPSAPALPSLAPLRTLQLMRGAQRSKA